MDLRAFSGNPELLRFSPRRLGSLEGGMLLLSQQSARPQLADSDDGSSVTSKAPSTLFSIARPKGSLMNTRHAISNALKSSGDAVDTAMIKNKFSRRKASTSSSGSSTRDWVHQGKSDSSGSRTPPLSPSCGSEGSASSDEENSPLPTPVHVAPASFVSECEEALDYGPDGIFVAPPLKFGLFSLQSSLSLGTISSANGSTDSFHTVSNGDERLGDSSDDDEKVELVIEAPLATPTLDSCPVIELPNVESLPIIEPVAAPSSDTSDEMEVEELHIRAPTTFSRTESSSSQSSYEAPKRPIRRKPVPRYSHEEDADDESIIEPPVIHMSLDDSGPAWDLTALASKSGFTHGERALQYHHKIEVLQNESPQWYLDQVAADEGTRRKRGAFAAIKRVKRIASAKVLRD